MRFTVSSTAVAMAASLALSGSVLAADGSRASSSGRAAPASRGAIAAPRAASAPRTASAPRATSAPVRTAAAPTRASAGAPVSRLAADQSPRTAPAGSEPVGTAVSRGGDGGGAVGGGTPVTSSGGGIETIQSSGHDRHGSSSGGTGKAVSRGDRPRGDRSTVGSAGPRTHPPYGGGGGWDGGYYPPYYWAYGGVGLGYFYYDPFFWGDPWGYGGGYYGGGGGGYSTSTRQVDDGELRLKVKPKKAQVFVDGHLEGTVDDFDGTFERLKLPEGPHRVELRLEGHQPLSFDVNILPNELVTYRGKLDPR